MKLEIDQALKDTIDHVTDLLANQKNVLSGIETTLNVKFVERTIFDSLLQSTTESTQMEKERLDTLESMLKQIHLVIQKYKSENDLMVK